MYELYLLFIAITELEMNFMWMLFLYFSDVLSISDDDEIDELESSDMDISLRDDEATLTMIEDVLDSSLEISNQTSPVIEESPCEHINVVTPNDHPFGVVKKLESAFQKLSSSSSPADLLELYKRPRVIVSIDKLIELKVTICMTVAGDRLYGKVVKYSTKIIGSRVDLEWKCEWPLWQVGIFWDIIPQSFL